MRFRPEPLETSENERADDAVRALPGLRPQRINTALKKKLRKLAYAKREFDATESILVLESDDVSLANKSVIGDAIRESLKDHEELPDTIYLVETDRGLSWQLWVMKIGDRVFPDLPEDDAPFDLGHPSSQVGGDV